jgi:hypothetical protein
VIKTESEFKVKMRKVGKRDWSRFTSCAANCGGCQGEGSIGVRPPSRGQQGKPAAVSVVPRTICERPPSLLKQGKTAANVVEDGCNGACGETDCGDCGVDMFGGHVNWDEIIKGCDGDVETCKSRLFLFKYRRGDQFIEFGGRLD